MTNSQGLAGKCGEATLRHRQAAAKWAKQSALVAVSALSLPDLWPMTKRLFCWQINDARRAENEKRMVEAASFFEWEGVTFVC